LYSTAIFSIFLLPMTSLIEYEAASDEVRAVYDDIRATRQTDYINNFWKALANHPSTLKLTWHNVKQVMTASGELDPLTRELIYIAVSVTNGCAYCIASHTAAGKSKGMNEAILGELQAIVATANASNQLANGYQIPVDEQFKT
jgi:AhpD family alkylhydroperoxidase